MRKVQWFAVGMVAISASVLGCQKLLGIEDYQASEGGAGGAGGASTSSTGVVPMLDDGGLIVRYFLDEAESGNDPMVINDSGPNQVHLTPTWEGMTYAVEGSSNRKSRGLHWTSVDSAGVASVPASSDIRLALHNHDTATIEVVARVSGGSSAGGVFVALGKSMSPGDLTFGPGDTFFRLRTRNDTVRVEWLRPNNTTVEVYHLVIDVSEATVGGNPTLHESYRLYRNGTLVPQTAQRVGAMTEDPFGPLLVGENQPFCLGNRAIGGRGFSGFLGYAAIYSVAMDEGRIQMHNNALRRSDDGPTDEP